MPGMRRDYISKLDDASINRVLSGVKALRIPLPSRRAKEELDALASQGILEDLEYFRAFGVPKGKPPHDVFVCHSSHDKEFVRKLAAALKNQGFKVWLDEFEMLPGDSLYDKIQQGIRKSSWFIIVLSPHSVKSKWCRRELHAALEQEFDRKRVYVVPVFFKQCRLPEFLKEKVYARCDGENYENGLQQLVNRLKKKTEGAKVRPNPALQPSPAKKRGRG
jgi:hypothetical protein